MKKDQYDSQKGANMTEWEKCLDGELYNCHAPEFIAAKGRASDWCRCYNAIPYSERAKRKDMLRELFGSVGDNVSVGDNFTCGFGVNIHIGSNVSINLNCTFIDCNKITIGSNVLIASCCHLTTATHPVRLEDRLNPNFTPENGQYFALTQALPITIEDGCWLGANVVVLPGVTIGRGSVVAAGAVVTKDVPPHTLVAGVPARVVKQI